MDNILIFAVVGFIAQMIDGSLGMGYGVSSSALLLGWGIPPAMASASVHIAELFSSGISGIAHLRFGNVDKVLFKKLLIPGVIGGIIGAYILTSIPGNKIKPFVAIYLFIMGLLILVRVFSKVGTDSSNTTKIMPLGFMGGFFDAIGGGGWGPIVTSTLVARGSNPRFVVGSVDTSEFFVTVAQSVTFFLTLGLVNLNVIAGLAIGGVMAAPIAAYICRRIPKRIFTVLVGILILILSTRILFQL